MTKLVSFLAICLIPLHLSALELKCELDSKVSQEMASGMQATALSTKSLSIASNESETLVILSLRQTLYKGFSKLVYTLEGVEAESIATVSSDNGSLELVATLSREITVLSILDAAENILAVGAYNCQ